MAKKKATPKDKEPKTKTVKVSTPSPQEDTESGDVDFALQLVNNGITVPKITEITDLLSDSQSMLAIAEKLCTGASIETIEMSLGLPLGMLAGWLKNGSDDIENDESPYRALYMFYRAAQAEAQHVAEASLLKKNPQAWLERMDIPAQLEKHQDKIKSVPGTVKVSDSDKGQAAEAGQYEEF